MKSNRPPILQGWHRSKPLILRCEGCGKSFEHWNYRDTKTCSKECADTVMAKTRKADGSYVRTKEAIDKGIQTKFGKNYKRRYEKKCAICGTVFWVKASKKDSRKTCSKKCMGVYNGDQKRGTVMSPEQREHLSKIRKERGLAKGKNNPNYGKGCHHPTARGTAGIRSDLGHMARSTPEANYARILRHEGIEYLYEPMHFPIIRDEVEQTFCPDFYLVKEDRYIEIKGFEKEDSMQKYECFRQQYPHIKIHMIKTQSEEWKQLKRKYDHVVNWEYTPGVLKQRKGLSMIKKEVI